MQSVWKMEASWKMFIVVLGLALIIGCSCKPTKENERNDVTADDMEIEEVEDSGIAEDKNPFDILEEINEAHDLTGLYQGDILIMKDKTKLSDISGGQEELDEAINEKRNVRNDKRYLWTGKVVPFLIDPSVQYLEYLLNEAMNEISNKTCIKFKKRESETNYVKFFQGQGCYSYIGRYFTGINTISIGKGCNKKGIIQHEIMHSLGFWHEQARSDRDKYIEIYWENIKQGTTTNFQKAENQEMLIDYDYNSVMHYGPYSFSANGKKTIVPISNPNAIIGQRDGMSPQDIIEINALYDCQSTSTDFYSSWGNWQPCNSGCIKQRQRFCSHTDLTKCPNVDYFGVETVLKQCTHDECYKPVDGHWGQWSSWTSCSKTCDWGTKKRSRACNQPAPKNGGKSCVGAAEGTSNCKKISCNLGPDDCEFENGLCFWVNVKNDQLDWTRHNGSTPSQNTGPSGDHTSGDGYYMFLEASSPAATGNTAILESNTMKKSASGQKCLIFWNHMDGEWMGALKVKMKDIATGKISILKTLKGNKGNKWNKEELLFVVNGDFKIQFEAARGASFSSDMALDDVYFKDGSCNPGSKPLGMEDKRIKDWQISASSHWDNDHKSFYARLNQPGPNQWCASWNKHGTDQYVRVDFDKRQLISGVAVQGQATYDNWVTSYKVKYTEDSYTWKTYQEGGIDKIFIGPKDRSTPAKQTFINVIRAFGIMINPQTYHGNDICMRIELYGIEDPVQPAKPAGCKNNVKALGMASRHIPDSSITATSIWDSDHQAYNGRLNYFKVWCAYPKKDYTNEYFIVDFGKPMKIFAVATQGQQSWNNYVTSYEVTYGLDGTHYFNIPKDYVTFQPLILTGNSDRNGIVKHKLPSAITARYVRIHPLKFHGADVCLRAEFYGCEPE